MENDFNTLLNYDECLVYIEDKEEFADSDGIIHIARVLSTPSISGESWYQLQVLTNKKGEYLETPTEMLTKADNIVTNRARRNIVPKSFYKFVSLDEDEEAPLIANGFVITSNPDLSLSRTTRTGFGSGIYGKYLLSESDVQTYKTENTQEVYKIDASDAYPVQDKEHCVSIITASLNTNRFLDKIIQAVKPNQDLTINDIFELIHNNDTSTLLTLWNIVFYRTQEYISAENLEEILAYYVNEYLFNKELSDSVSNKIIYVQPINNIMLAKGYTGLIGDDRYTNGWDKGCVSYLYENASILEGTIAPYQNALPIY